MTDQARRALQDAAKRMASRLEVLQKLAKQARERGDEEITLHVDEVFDSGDRAALAAFDQALHIIQGAQPLFPREDTTP